MQEPDWNRSRRVDATYHRRGAARSLVASGAMTPDQGRADREPPLLAAVIVVATEPIVGLRGGGLVTVLSRMA